MAHCCYLDTPSSSRLRGNTCQKKLGEEDRVRAVYSSTRINHQLKRWPTALSTAQSTEGICFLLSDDLALCQVDLKLVITGPKWAILSPLSGPTSEVKDLIHIVVLCLSFLLLRTLQQPCLSCQKEDKTRASLTVVDKLSTLSGLSYLLFWMRWVTSAS